MDRDTDGTADGETSEETPDGTGPDGDRGSDHPIDGTAFLKAAALASVPADRLPDLLNRVQAELGPRIDEYRRRYERVAAERDRETFLVEPDHWAAIGERLGFSERERAAVTRAHEAAVERAGSADDRRQEFDTALEIRSGVVIGVNADVDGEIGGDGEVDSDGDGKAARDGA
ncbi:hypothetical protein [Halorubrum sp. DTA98]|uniref:hypothetical protein n=1 Tax=Halorubrum sp. DTA98 TaxID=3402163 RepID=UPI003AAFAB9E